MVKTIGSGKDFLRRKTNACIDAGGVPQIKVGYADGSDQVVFSCWGRGDQVKGGTVRVSRSLKRELERADKKYTVVVGEGKVGEVKRNFNREW